VNLIDQLKCLMDESVVCCARNIKAIQ